MPQLFRVVDPRGQLPWQIREAFLGAVFPIQPLSADEIRATILCRQPLAVSPYRVSLSAAVRHLAAMPVIAQQLLDLTATVQPVDWIEFDDDEVELVLEPAPQSVVQPDTATVASA